MDWFVIAGLVLTGLVIISLGLYLLVRRSGSRASASYDRSSAPAGPSENVRHDEFDLADVDLSAASGDVVEAEDVANDQKADLSAFSPPNVRAATPFKIQLAIHGPELADEVASLATSRDPGAAFAAATELRMPLKQNQLIKLQLVAKGAKIVDQSVRHTEWKGKILTETFELIVEDESVDRLQPSVRIFVDGMPYGSLRWSISVDDHSDETDTIAVRLKHFRKVFVSYSSADRVEVLKRVQMIDVRGDQLFLDLLSLDAGARWEKELYKKIEECDAFYIFWSPNACESEWVMKELRYASDLQNRSPEGLPDIVPVILTVPPPKPPDFVADIHFNSMLAYVIAAHSY